MKGAPHRWDKAGLNGGDRQFNIPPAAFKMGIRPRSQMDWCP
ncbi:MAG: hypothetical protein U0X92_18225 [Anaerolineales bacterium]